MSEADGKPIRNVELMRKIIEDIRMYPEAFDMRRYGMLVEKDREHPCGTVGCIAGRTLLSSGYVVVALKVEGLAGKHQIFIPKDHPKPAHIGYAVSPKIEALRLLGLTYDEADVLFYRDEWFGTYKRLPEHDAAVALLNVLIAGGDIIALMKEEERTENLTDVELV